MDALKPVKLRIFRLPVVVALVLLVAWPAILAAPAHAATFTVTKTADTNDGACNSDCSLREAVVAANVAGGADTIEIPAGYYTITRPENDDTSAAGDLDITSNVTLKTTGPVTVDGAGLDRVVEVLASGTAKLSGLRITGGLTTAAGGVNNYGGGILNNFGGTLTLTNSTVSGNETTLTGGGIASYGTLTLTNSTVSGNVANTGGGIANLGGTATLTKTTVSRNQAPNAGGGIFIDAGSTLTLTNSTVTRNQAPTNFGGGGISNNGGTVTVSKSTLSGNQAVTAGGISSNGGTVTLANSTVSGNSADSDGGGVAVSGGTTTIAGSTITDNRSDSDGNNTGNGGGVFQSGGTVSIGNSILAGNADGPTTIHPDCSGTITSNNYNLIESTTGCTVTLQPNDDTGAVALGPLAFNGGSTETHSLPTGSTAVNHGPTSGSGSDQRGVVRPVGPAFDTGAYEKVLCSGLLVNVVGTNANDTLNGTARADGVLAQGGNDTVRSGAGNDKVCGGDGGDKLFGEAGNDKLLGEDGNDVLDGGPGNDACVGGRGTDKLKSC